ncbi:MAG: acetamidase/formamidase family protein [Candidatus Thorarchaeota archaeon]|jgi:amidase
MADEKTHRVSMRDVVFKADSRNPPVLRIKSGDTVVFECRDAFNQTIQEPTDLPINFDMERINPATGPVYVEGAHPGDTLEIHILDIDVAKQGSCCILPGFGYLSPEFPEPWTRIIPIEGGKAIFSEKVKIPIDPFPGTMIVAPAEGAHGTLIPKEYGGNMDSRACTIGTTVYLPVFVEGALFGVGDVHAVQGCRHENQSACRYHSWGKSSTSKINLHLIHYKMRMTPRMRFESRMTSFFFNNLVLRRL